MRIPKTSISLFPIGFFTRSKIREGGGGSMLIQFPVCK